ncbi:MAG: IS66 family insertion sequence element accessory protein TnpB [Maribacter sp.]|nr:IS66 family insertion sequence element accessory protein TnpB [Maribacter sp.]
MFEQSGVYYLYDQPTDMRKSFHTLGAIVVLHMGLTLQSGAGFVFINRRKTHLKMLRWEGDGFSLYFKRLEQGTFEHLCDLKNYSLSYEKLLLILRGIKTKNIKRRKRFSLGKSG